MNQITCDCLNSCGDDPWLKDGRSQPCEALRGQMKRSDRLQQLSKFYNVTNTFDLVEAQSVHIERLQENLATLDPVMRKMAGVKS